MYGGGRGRGRTATTLPATIQTSFKIPRLFRAISLVFNKSLSNLANLPISRSQGAPWAHCYAFISSVLCAKVISYPDLTLGRRLARKYNDSYRHVYEIFITGGPVVHCYAFISSVLCAKIISYPDLTLGRRLARKYNDSYRHVYEIFITGGPVVEVGGGCLVTFYACSS